MKVLLAYYSKTGHTAKVALAVEAALKAHGVSLEVLRVQRKVESGFFGSATDARHRGRPEITGVPKDVAPYDIVFMGFPTWGFCAASPANSMVAGLTGLSGKRVALFATSGFDRGFVNGLNQISQDLKALGAEVVAAEGFPNGEKQSIPERVQRLVGESLRLVTV